MEPKRIKYITDQNNPEVKAYKEAVERGTVKKKLLDKIDDVDPVFEDPDIQWTTQKAIIYQKGFLQCKKIIRKLVRES